MKKYLERDNNVTIFVLSKSQSKLCKMKTSIKNVTDSKTYQVYEQLLELGFNVTLSSMFSYNYGKDNRYLSISVKEAEQRLNELWDITKGFEVVLSKDAHTDEILFEVRNHRDYAEFVTDEIWMEYYNGTLIS